MRSPDGVLFHLTSKLVSATPIEPKAPLPFALPQPEPEPELELVRSVPTPEAVAPPQSEPEREVAPPPEPEPATPPEPEPEPATRPETEPQVEQTADLTAGQEPTRDHAPAAPGEQARTPAPLPGPEAAPGTAPEQLAAAAAYTFDGIDGRLEVSPESVSLARHGPGGILYRQGERKVQMKDVTVVHLAPASATGRGFIQVCFAGGPQTRASYWEAPKHPETLQFTMLNQPLFESARDWIVYYAGLARAGGGAGPN
jgi:hypothetical protein